MSCGCCLPRDEDEGFNPVQIGLFGTRALVLYPQPRPNLIQQMGALAVSTPCSMCHPSPTANLLGIEHVEISRFRLDGRAAILDGDPCSS